jgi:hypothetical protein
VKATIDRLKIMQKSRYADDLRKGEIVKVYRILSSPPLITERIYLVETEDGRIAWTIDSEVTPWNQLSLLDPIEDST